MTAADWQAATDPRPMLAFLGTAAGARKLRLFAAACCAQARIYTPAEWHHQLEELEEQPGATAEWAANVAAACAALCGDVDGDRTHPKGLGDVIATENAFQKSHCRFIREIFGDPFRPVAFDPSWRTSDVVALAQGIDADLAFDRMPILADALQDAGCEDATMLNHLRGTDRHVRGCWALDLALGHTDE